MPAKMKLKKRQPALQPGESLRPKPRGYDAVNGIRLGANQQSDFQLGDHATEYGKHPRDVITDKQIYREKRPNLVPGESIRHKPTLVNNVTCDSMRAAIKQHDAPTDYRARDGHFRVSTIAQKKALQGTQASHSLGNTVTSHLNGGPRVKQTGVFVPNNTNSNRAMNAGQQIVSGRGGSAPNLTQTTAQTMYGSNFYEAVPQVQAQGGNNFRTPDPAYQIPKPKSGHLRSTMDGMGAHLPTERTAAKMSVAPTDPENYWKQRSQNHGRQVQQVIPQGPLHPSRTTKNFGHITTVQNPDQFRNNILLVQR